MLFLSITSSDKAQVAWWAAHRPDVRLRVAESPGASNLTIQATSHRQLGETTLSGVMVLLHTSYTGLDT